MSHSYLKASRAHRGLLFGSIIRLLCDLVILPLFCFWGTRDLPFFSHQPRSKGPYFSFVSEYFLLVYWQLLFPEAFLLKESIWHRQWEPSLWHTFGDFRHRRLALQIIKVCRSQAKEEVRSYERGCPSQSWREFVLIKPPCTLLFTLEFSSLVLPPSSLNKSLIVRKHVASVVQIW